MIMAHPQSARQLSMGMHRFVDDESCVMCQACSMFPQHLANDCLIVLIAACSHTSWASVVSIV